MLPEIDVYLPTRHRRSPPHEAFVRHDRSRSCGAPARRETDTMDTFVESSWYFVRYCRRAERRRDLSSRERSRAGCRSTSTSAAIEHAVLHLLYARFFTKVLLRRGPGAGRRAVPGLFTQGMVQRRVCTPLEAVRRTVAASRRRSSAQGRSACRAPLVARGDGARQLRSRATTLRSKRDDGSVRGERAGDDEQERRQRRADGPVRAPARLGRRADHDPVRRPAREQHGVDRRGCGRRAALPEPDRRRSSGRAATRSQRWLRSRRPGALEALLARRSSMLRKRRFVVERTRRSRRSRADTERLGLNTAIAALMELLNEAQRYRSSTAAGDTALLARLRGPSRACLRRSPRISPRSCTSGSAASGTRVRCGLAELGRGGAHRGQIEIVLQVNGKVRDRATVARNAEEEALRSLALGSAKVREAVGGAEFASVVIVPGRLVNVVVA